MANNNTTNAKLFIEAVLADMSGLSKELRGNLESVDSTIPLKFDSKEVEESVLETLRQVFGKLNNSKGFARHLDLSNLISQTFGYLQSDVPDNFKSDFVNNFAAGVDVFESFASKFEGDSDAVAKTIKQLNENLGGQGIQKYLQDLQAVYKFVDSLELKRADKESLLRSFTSSLGVGVDANGLGDALGLKEISKEFKDVNKYAVSVKEARTRLIKLLGGSDKMRGWDSLQSGSKIRNDTERVRDIAGFISRIQALSGKEITAYLQDKIDDAQTDEKTRAQLEQLRNLYTKEGGWGEYFQKWSDSQNENTKANMSKIGQENQRIVEMTKRQLEERNKVLEQYGQFNSSLLTRGENPQATINYDNKIAATETSEQLSEEEQQRRQIIDEINKEAESLKTKLNILKEIAELQKQVVVSGVESSPEFQEMQALQDAINDVTFAVDNKTRAFENEQGTVHSVVESEIKDLKKIKEELDAIVNFNDEKKLNAISKSSKKVKEKTEEQKRAEQEARQRTAAEVQSNTVLGQYRQEQQEKEGKEKNKPKAKAGIKRPIISNEKTANEREAQALKDIKDNADIAAEGLKKFGDTNNEIAQNVTTVAEALKKEASALNSMAKSFLKIEESKMFQQARKDKLYDDLSETRNKIDLSKKEIDDFQNSSNISIFDNGRLEEATSQLRNAYKDVVSFREVYSKDNSQENVIEMAKREIKLWKAYKEAEKQGITESNLEAKRLSPQTLGIDIHKNADNTQILREELDRRKQIYEDYVKQSESIQKELEEIENPPTQKNLKNKDEKIKEYQEIISAIKEYIDAQKQLVETQQSSIPETTEAKFSPEQLEQFSTALEGISDSLEKIKTTLGTLDDNSDIPSITKAVEEMAKVFEKLKLLIDNINDKKIKFGFSSNPDEKLIGEMNFEDVQNSLTNMFDDAIKKIQDFKTNVDMSETVKNFKKQISEMEKSIKTLEKALEKEKKAREKDKADVKAKEEKRAQEAAQKAEEKIRQEALAKEKAEQEQRQKEEEALRKKQEAEEQKRQAEEIARKKREAQEQYENQFHAWNKDGQLSFLDKNDYDLQNEYLELQKQEVEQLAKQAEQNPPKVNIPIEGQISFTNEKDINEIADEILYKNNFIADENGQYSLFQGVEAASDWGQELKENLQEASKTDFSNIKNQLSLKDWEATIDETNKSVESRFKKIYDSKSFIQNTDLPDDILKTYENISTKNGEGFKATSNLRELKNLGDELQNVKTKLKVSFDEVGNLKSTADPLQTQELLNRYDELVDKIQRLKLIISSPSSQESFLLEEFKQLAEAEKEAINNAENLKKKTQEVLDKTLSDKKFTSGKDTDITSLDNYFRVGSSENLDKVRSTVEEINNLKRQLIDSRDTDGNIIGNPEQVQSLIDKYNNLVKVLESLIVKIKLSDSVETIGLKIAEDAEKAENELKELKDKIDSFFETRSDELVKKNAINTIQSYGTLNAEGSIIPLESLSTDGVNSDSINKIKEQQQNVINLNHALEEYIKSVEKLKQLRESDTIDLKELKQASEEVDSLKNKVDALIKLTKKGTANATGKEVSGLTNKIESLLGSDANLSDDVSNKLKNYLDILKSGATISKASYESMKADVQQFSAEQKKSFSIWDMMTLKMKEGIAFLATKFSFYQIFNQFRQGVQIIHQFDDALTEMMKVSDETRQSLEAYQKTTFATADAIGSNALQIQNSTADFMRLGESLKEASESAKTANILMNVSEFQSIDEATKSLIAMSAAYDDLSKMQIIDKLNEVGNNYSISTSGAAEALQASASALRTAGNDMDEALALVTAGNQIVQDVSKAGNGLRTIALRLTGTKSAKEELEELGEDTDSLITTQSKLRDTIKEATAVASNQFKGFDILDDNGNYKSTYEIMLGIAQIYQEIVDTDKELGRNNANLLLETVAGKTRANIAASIFQSPDVLEAAYKSSQGAQDSAMRENEKYIESISGHLAQLTNQWQEMWANAANREVINFFIDIGKNLLAIANTLGVIPTSLALIALYLNVIKKGAEGKTLTKAIKGILVGLSDMEGKAGEAGAALLSLGSGLKTSFSAIIPILGGVATAIGIVGTAAYAYYQHQKQVQKELVNSAKTANSEWQQQKQTLSEYSSQYEELKNKLDTGNLSEQETIEIKQKIYDIQKQITDQYGNTANKIDLINGELNEQLLLIDNISQAEADRIWYSDDYQKGFELAKKAMTTESEYALSMALDFENYKTPEDKALSHIIQKYTQERSYGRDSGQIGTYRAIVGNPVEADERILKMMEEIEKLQEQNPYNKDLQKRAENVTSFLKQYRDDIGKIRQDNESAYLEGLPIELLATRAYKDYEIYSNYQSSVSNLESAYALGDSKKIKQARDDFEEATKAKEEFLKVPANNEFSILFDNIDTSVIDTKNRTEDATKAIKNSLQMGKEISRLEDYNQQKQQADNYVKNNLENLQQIGNIDNTNRPFIFWDAKEVKKQQEALESWGQSIEDVVGSYSTVFGGSGEFDGVDIAFTPIINDGTGKGKLLTKETLYNYINTLIANAGEGWTNDELFKLDAEGLVIDGQYISNVLGVVGNSMSEMGLTAEEVGEKMHDWQAESIGYIANFQDEWKKAIKQGKTFEEFMQDQEKDLKDTSKATGKYTKEDKKLYQALKKVIDLNIDRVDAEQAFDASANGSQIYRNALENLMNALGYTIDDSGLMIDMLVANSIVHGDVADATNSASNAYNQFSQEIATAIENVSKLNTVLTESVSGAGISTQNIDAFKEMFGDDYVYALERSANGYHINAEKLQTLIDKQNALTNSDYQKTLDAQYDALKRCNDEIIKANNEQKDTSGLLAQRQGILQRIQDTQDLMMAYQASTSAFQTWTNAQSNGNEYDMYDKIANGYDTVKDLIDRGWSGDDTVRSYLDLIYGESFDAFTASGEECAEMFDKLDEKIEGTSFSIRDFFQFDSSGKITSNGIFNFFDALKEKQEQLGLSDDEKWIKDDGTYDFGFGRDRAAAEQLGIDVEFFQSMLRAAVSAGFELNLDQPMWAMDELEKKAIKAQEELGGFNDIDFKELYNNLDDEDAYETISGHIDDVYDYIQKIEDSDLSPELKTQQIEQAQDMLSYLVALEREAADKGDINLKATVVGSAKEELGKLIEETDELPEALKQYNWDEITDKDGLQKARNYIAAEIEGGRIDSSSAEAFLNILDQALDELNLIDEYEANPTLQGNTVGAFNDVKQAREELEKYIADAQQLEDKYDIKFNFAEDEEVKKLLSTIYGEGTPEILASLGIDSGKTPEEIIEMLELGERDIDVLLKPDSSELEKSVQNSGKTVVTNTVSKQTNSVVNETKNLVTEYTEQITNASMDTSDYDKGKQHVEKGNEELDKQNPESKAGMDTKDFNKKASDAESKVKTLDGLNATPYVSLGGASQVASAAESIRSQIASIKGKTVSVVANFSSSGLSALKSGIQSVLNKANELASNYTAHFANGTAHVRGTAFAKGSIVSNHAYAGGKWGLPDNQTALTGELGTEIVVRDGNWFTVGDDGAEFVNLKKGDIVFNHKQSEELLENGYVTSNKGRGHLVGFANGTAYSSGNTSGATRARVATSSSKSSSSRSSGGGSRGSGGSGGSGGGNSSSKDAKETKNTLDEVEILIGRIEARISDLDKIIGSTYNTWTDRNDSILDNLKLVTQEISDQRKAYTTYMNKANSINLSESWKQKIRDGAFRIEDVTDSDLWDKIQEYQTW